MKHSTFVLRLGLWLLLSLYLTPAVADAVSAPASNESSEAGPLVLAVGEQRILRTPALKNFSVGGDHCRAHTLSPGSLLLKAISPGASDLWVWKTDGTSEHRTVRVEKSDAGSPASALERALGGLQETEVYLAGGTVLLRGEVQSSAESARVAALLQGFPKQIQDETSLSSELLEKGRSLLTAWAAADSRRGLTVEIQDGHVWVRGSVPGPLDRESLERRIRAIFPLAETDLESFPDNARTVHFRVFLLELKKTRFGSFGLSWPSQVAGAFRVTSWGATEALSLDLAIQALEGEGSARVLSNPEMSVRAPGEAELFSGGEIPIRSISQYSANVAWKDYGLLLKLHVTHAAGERVRLDIITEVSSLDLGTGSDQIPGIRSNRMKTQVEARFGVPLFLSGLLQDANREQARGLPWLRRIPVLGSLFGSDDYLNERSELVAILVPSAAPPAAPMHRVASGFGLTNDSVHGEDSRKNSIRVGPASPRMSRALKRLARAHAARIHLP